MNRLTRGAGLVIIAGMTALTGCGTTSTGSASPAAAASSAPSATNNAPPATSTAAPSASSQTGTDRAGAESPACSQRGSYLTAVTTGRHDSYDRVVFQFSGGLPAATAERVPAVYHDPKGTAIALAGQSYLHVVFRGASGHCPQPSRRTWTGPSVLTPNYPQLLMVSAAGDFEGYLSFGLGLAARGSYHVSTLTRPDRVVVDVSHVASPVRGSLPRSPTDRPEPATPCR